MLADSYLIFTYFNRTGNIASFHTWCYELQRLLLLCISQVHSHTLQTHLSDYFLNRFYRKEQFLQENQNQAID